jgi:gluconate 2-dehydrogenase gamma chain
VKNESPELMKRREVLKRAAWLLGGAVSAPAALAILQGCSAKNAAPGATAYLPQTLSADQYAIVADIAEIMIPRTDTSGAKDAGVPAFIDQVLGAVFDDKARERFSAGCAELQAVVFLEQDLPARTSYVQQSLERALGEQSADRPFILVVRELALLGFFTSEVGITENMEYVAVPGAFHGCVPVSQMKKPVYWE